MRGLILLVAINDSQAETIKDRLTLKFTAQGVYCQNLADGLTGNDLWTIDGDHGTKTYDLNRMLFIGTPADFLVEGEAICGFKIGENGDGNLLLNLYHGKVNSNGYISGTPTLAYSFGSVYDIKPENQGISQNKAYFNTYSISVPEGHVITNIGLNVYSSYMVQTGKGYGIVDHYYRGTYLVVKHAPINADGTIDANNVGTLSSAGDFGKTSSSNAEPAENFQSWRLFNGENIQTTPMTGIQMHAGSYFSPTTKDSIHQKSFK
ncbi:MAG: hypothetical protein JKY48_12160 [Flavobacteriales bacterium]|nr:hypothetical protein [Flavobacteriales bacterium]